MNTFQDKILKLRKSKNYTQEDLAKILYVSRQAISKWENGISYPSMDIMNQIAQIFNISVDELFDSNDVRINTFKNNAKITNIKKTNIIISIIIFIALVISIIGYSTAKKAHGLNTGDQVIPPEDYLVGFVVITSDAIKEIDLDINNIDSSGYAYYIKTYENNAIDSESFGLYNVTINVPNSLDATIYVNTNLLNFITICNIYKSIDGDELYIKVATSLKINNTSSVSFKQDGLERVEELNYNIVIKTINTVESIKLIEYDINNNNINEIMIDDELKEYTLSNDCLYIVFEEKHINSNGEYFYSRDIVTSAQINGSYYYGLKISNDKGFAYKKIIIKPTLND